MAFQSKNMNYIFHVEYFKDIFAKRNGKEMFVENAKDILAERNKEIFDFSFAGDYPLAECENMEGYHKFSLFTLYPGLLVGTGNPHEIAVDGALKCGFTFDYVTGLPYITGSTLKGMIRSYFPGDSKNDEVNKEYDSLIKGLLGKDDTLDVLALKENMFVNADIFLGAFPIVSGQKKSLLDMEFITPHSDKFKNPNPISLVKVKPAVEFEFSFVFSDYVENGEVIVSAADKAKLCEELLLLVGIGAKTNVGFGRLSKEKPKMHVLVDRAAGAKTNGKNANSSRTFSSGGKHTERPNGAAKDAPICPVCRKKRCGYNKYKDTYFPTCFDCSQKGKNK